MKIAGIDVHKRVLVVVVVDARAPEAKPARRRFATMAQASPYQLTMGIDISVQPE